ncbi:tetratricopeptide repeat protein [Aquimarina pacifica]|uniref:tetratricopeptide repeat protein n=1 Tax=Aquimarina pacifica TaxID=1296415 RepID=UPI0004713AB6|nr:tetratricopeptide repeat protein [Aquimarina pacifica]
MNKRIIYISVLILLISTTILYLNHFDNSFHFDDSHTVTGNVYIQDIKNIPLFFKDGSTISSLPQNQSYRPIVTTSLAIDYWLGKGYIPFYFHITSFILFLIQGVLIFFIAKRIIDLSRESSYNTYISGFIALWYMIHPVMAETVNYVIARSDLQSTFFVALSFILYQYSKKAKKYYLYLIPIIIGALAKPTAIMFAPLFFVYVTLFEEKMSFIQLFNPKNLKKTFSALKKTLPAILVCASLYMFIITMTPESYTTGSAKTLNYLITQPFVITYYFISSILPIHLSADTDWKVFDNIWSYKFFLGILFVIILISIAFISSKKKKYYPISFGIAWFFISLIPSSSIIPLAEVMNDHRMFFPYIGLLIALGWGAALLAMRIQKKYSVNKRYGVLCISSILLLYAYGTYQRNEVWDNDESLWKDVTIKSPKNGRGLMNYGLSQMSKGEYKIAEKYFLKALEYTPYYHTLYINLGILNNTQGNTESAEKYFKEAIKYGSKYYSPRFYYGRFLTRNNRAAEAIEQLSKALDISPSHITTRLLLMENYLELEDWDNLQKIAKQTLSIDKNNKKAQLFLVSSVEKISKLETEEKEILVNPSAQKYLNLSLKYYQKKQYIKCVEMAQKAIDLQPDYSEAYNNICTAYNLLGDYEKAINACNKALAINPGYNLAKNNLKDVLERKTKLKNHTLKLAENSSEANYLDLSLFYYKNGRYVRCIEIAKEGIIKHPNSDNLYNNICAAYNELKDWENAYKAGQKGLKLNPDNQLLKNNYHIAKKNRIE